jgi:hypothetical protein
MLLYHFIQVSLDRRLTYRWIATFVSISVSYYAIKLTERLFYGNINPFWVVNRHRQKQFKVLVNVMHLFFHHIMNYDTLVNALASISVFAVLKVPIFVSHCCLFVTSISICTTKRCSYKFARPAFTFNSNKMSSTTTQKTLLPIQCLSCSYNWLTASQLYYITCPRCRHAFKIRNFVRYRGKVLQPGQDTTRVQAARTTVSPAMAGDNG